MKHGLVVCCGGADGFRMVEVASDRAAPGGIDAEIVACEDGVLVDGVHVRESGAARVGSRVWSCLQARFGAGGVREARLGRMAGASDAMIEVMHNVASATLSFEPVLILGESGTGKELAAQYLGESAGSIHAVNMGAVPVDLAEAELFGWTRGSFTGAVDSRAGALELAGSGVLFLDELAEAPAWVQVKLLRALDARRFRRLGASRDIPLSARLVAATNVDPVEGVASGVLRLDLLERLACHVIRMPSLRTRPADIPCLVRVFSDLPSSGVRDLLPGPSPEVMDLLRSWPWPGNVRELRNVVRRVLLESLDGMASPSVVRRALEQGRVFRAETRFDAFETASESRSVEIGRSGLKRSTFYYRLKRGRVPGDRGPRRTPTVVSSKI